MAKRKIVHRGKYYDRTTSEHSKLEKALDRAGLKIVAKEAPNATH